MSAEVNPSKDPTWSWKVWKEQKQGKRNEELPEKLRDLVRGKKPEQWSEAERKSVYEFWLANVYLGASEIVAPLHREKSPLTQEKEKIEKATPITLVMADLPTPRESFVMVRGQIQSTGRKSLARSALLFTTAPRKTGGPGVQIDSISRTGWSAGITLSPLG